MKFTFDKGNVRRLEIHYGDGGAAALNVDVVFSTPTLQAVSQHTVHLILDGSEKDENLKALAARARQLHEDTLTYLGDHLREGNSRNERGDDGEDAPGRSEGLGGHPFVR